MMSVVETPNDETKTKASHGARHGQGTSFFFVDTLLKKAPYCTEKKFLFGGVKEWYPTKNLIAHLGVQQKFSLDMTKSSNFRDDFWVRSPVILIFVLAKKWYALMCTSIVTKRSISMGRWR